jgi:glycosyltransferase involved in cell wall biosynthesis
VPSVLGVQPVDHPGGAEVGFVRLGARLRDRGWDVTISSPREGWLSEAGFPWLRLDVGGLGAGEGSRAVASYPRALRLSSRFDVMYLNSTVCGRLLPALRGRAKTVLHVHDIVDRVPRHWAQADLVLADSQAVADRLEGLEAHVVGCPVELDPPHVDRPWPDGGPVVGYVGRIEPRKGVRDLLAAVPQIRAGAPDARVVLVGDDPWDAFPEELAAVRADRSVDQLAWRDDAPSLMRHFDVLVLPSHQEPFGTVLGEAMAVGTPVVATTVGGLPEVVDDGVTGVLVPPGEPAALAAGVLRVLERRAAMGEAAQAHAQRFGADAYADRVEPLLRGLLA